MLNRKKWSMILCFLAVLVAVIICLAKTTNDYLPAPNETTETTVNEQDKKRGPQEKITVPLPNAVQLNVEADGLFLHETKSSAEMHIRSTDQTTIYELLEDKKSMGFVKVTVREIDNGDFFIFTQLENKSDKNYSVSISYRIDGNVHYDLTDFEREKINHEHDHVFGVDPTTHPIGLLKVTEHENFVTNMMLSRNYVSKELRYEYEYGDKSIVRELTSENKNLELNRDKKALTITLPLSSSGKDLSENWMLVSQKPLFKNKETLDEWIEQSIKQYKATNKWYTAEGPYTKLPWSIEPETKMGYGRNLVRVQDQEALTHYEATKERYFYDLMINSVANLFIFQGDRNGLWETEYTSTWLKKNYGIKAPYVDTRHNEKIALFLKQTGDLLDIKELKHANIMYADFLVDQVNNGNIIEVSGGGYLITDYYSPHQIKKTHVSLNHALGEMNLLLETYKQTKEASYLETAKNMKRGIENIGEKWLRDNGDVWYQVNGDFSFEGTDYPILTLEDLMNSQQALEAVGEKRSELFDKLIRSKAAYLTESKQEIPRSAANNLIKQGFGEIIEGYSTGY